jgi:hypothetical protein
MTDEEYEIEIQSDDFAKVDLMEGRFNAARRYRMMLIDDNDEIIKMEAEVRAVSWQEIQWMKSVNYSMVARRVVIKKP